MIVFEAEDQVGGIAKTEVREGPGGEYRFDLGGHRFFTKVAGGRRPLARDHARGVPAAPAHVAHLLAPALPRLPARGPDVIRKLGPVELTRCMASYARAKLGRKGEERTLEQWVTNRFGKRLFENFFKSYNEKLWGVPVSEIRAEFAAQRIKGLSFFSRRQVGVLRQQGQRDQEPDRRVPLPALRAGPDVGDDDRRHPRGSAARCCWRRRSRRCTSRTARGQRVTAGGRRLRGRPT